MRPLGYLHEIWMCPDETGQLLPACIPFGPSGDRARELLEPGSECVWVFWSNTNYETMRIYYEFVGYGAYVTDEEWRNERYPDEWCEEQLQYLRNL